MQRRLHGSHRDTEQVGDPREWEILVEPKHDDRPLPPRQRSQRIDQLMDWRIAVHRVALHARMAAHHRQPAMLISAPVDHDGPQPRRRMVDAAESAMQFRECLLDNIFRDGGRAEYESSEANQPIMLAQVDIGESRRRIIRSRFRQIHRDSLSRIWDHTTMTPQPTKRFLRNAHTHGAPRARSRLRTS